MNKTVRAKYTLEFKREAVAGGERPDDGRRGLQPQNCRADVVQLGKSPAARTAHGRRQQPVSAEQMEISRLKAELAKVKMERDILGKATAYFAKGLT